MTKRAKIYTFTIINSTTEAFKDKTPYTVGILEDDKHRFASFIEGYEEGLEVKVGMDVEFSRMDEAGNPIYKFVS